MPTPLGERKLQQRLTKTLSTGIGNGTALAVSVGLNWTCVRGPNGMGLAHTPARGTAGCRSLTDAGSYRGRPLKELALLYRSNNPFEVALGIAAANAAHNRFDLKVPDGNGLDAFTTTRGPTAVVGHFPGIRRHLTNAQVIEREPNSDELPEEAAENVLPQAAQVLITASTLTNGSLTRLLSLCHQARIVLVGPSVPMCPSMFQLGIDVLSGFLVTNPEGALTVVAEGGSVSALKRYGRLVMLQRNNAVQKPG